MNDILILGLFFISIHHETSGLDLKKVVTLQ